MEDSTTRAGGLAAFVSRAALPLLVVLLGLALTTLMAVVQQDGAEREQELMFNQAAERQRQGLIQSMSAEMHLLEEAVQFISATYPSDVNEFRSFFRDARAIGPASNIDAGVILIEAIDSNDVSILEAREHALGNDDFRVQFIGPRPQGELLVITRTAREVRVGPIGLEGLEISNVIQGLLAGDSIETGPSVRPLDTQSLIAQFLSVGTIDDTNEPPVLMAATIPIVDPDSGETAAWAIRLFDPNGLVTGLGADIDRRLNVEIHMDALESPIVLGETDKPLLFNAAHLKDEVRTRSSGLDWTIRIWAARDFGLPIGLADQGATWTFGLLVTSAIVLGAVWRAVQEYRLSAANSELRRARALASTDSLTGLLNRQGFIDGVRALDLSVAGTLFFIDLDGFKRVNDSLGHEAGDEVLREAAELLSGQFRGVDLVSRFGGDEFAVFTPGLMDADHHIALSTQVISALASIEASVSCSVGTATKAAYDNVDVLELIRRADTAMYRAKHSGGGRHESSKGNKAA